MATYALYGEIKLPEKDGRPGFLIRRFSECKIESSWKGQTDTATIEIPRNLRDFDKEKPSEWFRIGDPVEIYLGYDGNLTLEFAGYISEIDAGIPIKISCQDEMYQLKQDTISISKVDATLKDLLKEIAPGYKVECEETQLIGKVRFSNMSPALCLEELSKQGITCYFIGKTLHAMDTARRLDGKTHNIILERTATDGQPLKIKEIKDTKVIIESSNKKGQKSKVEFGDQKTKTIIRRSFSGLNLDKSEMKQMAEKIFKRAKTPGLTGDIVLFGVPSVKVGDKLKLRSVIYSKTPEFGTDNIKYSYEIDTVSKVFSCEEPSYRQVCTLGDRVVNS